MSQMATRSITRSQYSVHSPPNTPPHQNILMQSAINTPLTQQPAQGTMLSPFAVPILPQSQSTQDFDFAQEFDRRFARLEQFITQEVASLKIYIEDTLNEKLIDLRKYVDSEIAVVHNRMHELEQVTKDLICENEKSSIFDPETTIVAENLAFEEDEDLDGKVENMIRKDLAINVPVVRTQRLTPRPPRYTRHGNWSKPGIVKIQFNNKDDKIAVLKEKKHLSNSQDFSHVYLRSSKSYSERIMEQNLRTLLELMPDGDSWQVAGNGRVVRRYNSSYGNAFNRQDYDPDRQHDRPSYRRYDSPPNNGQPSRERFDPLPRTDYSTHHSPPYDRHLSRERFVPHPGTDHSTRDPPPNNRHLSRESFDTVIQNDNM